MTRPRGSVDRGGRAARVSRQSARSMALKIARALRARRLEIDVSASELAAAVNVWPGTVHRIEAGGQVPSLTLLCALAAALQMPVAALVEVG